MKINAIALAFALIATPAMASSNENSNSVVDSDNPYFSDQDRYSDINEFVGQGDSAFDSMIAEDNKANTIITTVDGKQVAISDDSKSSLADDWKAGFDLQCVDWKITGGCIWLKFEGFTVSVKTSLKVSHYSPDAIVEVFHNIDDTPTSYAKLNNKIAKSLGNSLFSKVALKGNKMNNNDSEGDGFHDVHVMGNPLISMHDSIIGTMYNNIGYCDSGATPFKTYMHSFTDVEWRLGIWETVNAFRYAYMSITDKAKVQVNDYDANPAGALWGSLYPRIGTTENPSPFIGAAISALRAGVLVTNSSGIHTLTKMKGSTDGKQFFNNKVDLQNGKWKVLLPKKFAGEQCSTMPFKGISNYSGTNEPESNSRNYVLQLWRQYICCERKGSYIGGW
ncbi:TraU family protein [Photobacterium leiognathi]|uniref:TraU family protein n=1 Tax=Photobacterium leiognathi TaxID=553611 RepID=UPI00298195CA|nr:TraU family protein [Photobacterium leiognathi]